jgi:molybdopterin converting factor small subunit
MVEIKFGDQMEVSELAGQTVSEAREQFKAEFGIPNKAQAKLNGSKVKSNAEIDTVLNDDDKLTFVVSRGKGAYLVGALLLALAVTGGIFASGWINNTTTLSANVYESNFADVTVNTTSAVTWNGWGFFKGTIPAGTLFDIIPGTSYSGDLAITVTIANGDLLAKRYKVLAFTLEVVADSAPTTPVDISAGNGNLWTMLTLDNGQASMFVDGVSSPLTVKVKNGFYITHAHPSPSWSGAGAPQLFCEVAQR